MGGFVCDKTHRLCHRDAELFQHLEPQTAHHQALRYDSCSNLFRSPKRLKNGYSFVHNPKNAGTGVDRILGIPTIHASMRRLLELHANRPRPAKPYFATLRHPIEQLVSWHTFLKAGRRQFDSEQRQRHFCERNTGFAFNTTCIPKLSEYEFIPSSAPSIYEHHHITGAHFHAKSLDEAIGTDANFQVEYLKPLGNSTMADVKQFVVEKFILLGDAAEMSPFYAMLMKGFDVNRTKVMETVHLRPNPSKHRDVRELFSKRAYSVLARRHSKDIELYYWGLEQINVLKRCYRDMN